jgi:hypothetical protein
MKDIFSAENLMTESMQQLLEDGALPRRCFRFANLLIPSETPVEFFLSAISRDFELG